MKSKYRITHNPYSNPEFSIQIRNKDSSFWFTKCVTHTLEEAHIFLRSLKNQEEMQENYNLNEVEIVYED